MNKLSIVIAQHDGAVKHHINNRSLATTRFLAAAALMLLASGGLWLTGFAAQPSLHDAAHDTRHGLNFPCH